MRKRGRCVTQRDAILTAAERDAKLPALRMKAAIPKRSVYRLSVYLRCLEQQFQDGVKTISSQTLAQTAGVKPTQLRKDLTFFGHFGKRGLGYDVGTLRDRIAEVLGRK